MVNRDKLKPVDRDIAWDGVAVRPRRDSRVHMNTGVPVRSNRNAPERPLHGHGQTLEIIEEDEDTNSVGEDSAQVDPTVFCGVPNSSAVTNHSPAAQDTVTDPSSHPTPVPSTSAGNSQSDVLPRYSLRPRKRLHSPSAPSALEAKRLRRKALSEVATFFLC